MRRVAKTVDADFEGMATLTRSDGAAIDVPCKIWFPRHDYENPYFFFQATDSKCGRDIGSFRNGTIKSQNLGNIAAKGLLDLVRSITPDDIRKGHLAQKKLNAKVSVG